MTDSCVKILHYDDEPMTVSWLSGTLLNHFYLAEGSFQPDPEGDVEAEDGSVAQFVLKNGADTITVDYVIVTSSEEFRSSFQERPAQIVIVDWLREDPGGGASVEGEAIYEKAKDALGADRVFILTAYPNRLPATMGESVPAGRLFLKPPDVKELVGEIAHLITGEDR